MEEWKSRLYQSYVSTRQAAGSVDAIGALSLQNYPYFQGIIRRHLSADRNIQIADLGCGYGTLIFCLRELGYKNLRGVDVSREQVQLAHRLGILNVEEDNISDFLSRCDDEFDVIFMMDIIEHMTKQELMDTLDKVYNSLRESGMLIIHVPNAEGIFGMRMRYADITHELSFTPKSMEQILKVTGFDEIRAYEDKPIIHGFKSLIRALLWRCLTVFPRLVLAAETGDYKSILSQNMTVTARKKN